MTISQCSSTENVIKLQAQQHEFSEGNGQNIEMAYKINERNLHVPRKETGVKEGRKPEPRQEGNTLSETPAVQLKISMSSCMKSVMKDLRTSK